MPKGYTNKEAIENYILQEIDVSFDTQLDAWIAGVETIIDQITGRNFIADSAASARVMPPGSACAPMVVSPPDHSGGNCVGAAARSSAARAPKPWRGAQPTARRGASLIAGAGSRST